MSYEELSQERKALQKQGLVPEWYTTGGYQMFKEKYECETNGRSVRGQFERIAKTAAKHLEGTSLHINAEQKFFDLFWNGWVSPSTPVLANTGTSRGLPVSCSGTVISDSIAGFYDNLSEVAILTKHGFGTASDFSHIRPRGSKISIGGTANGVMPVIKDHVTAMRNVSQGTARRGAFAVYLNIEHADVPEVLEYLLAEPDDLNIGWTVHQTFIARLNAGDKEASDLFKRIMKVKLVTGKGYFFFIDKANDKRPVMYRDLGLKINNSQLCNEVMLFNDEDHTYTCQPGFAPIIKKGVGLTNMDNISVGDYIWSKEGWTRVVNKVNSGVKEVKSFSTSYGKFIGTDDHRIVENGTKVQVKNAKTIDGVVFEYQHQQDVIVPEMVMHGLLIGDGTFRSGRIQLCVGENDADYYESEVSHLVSKDGSQFFRNVKQTLISDLPCTYDRDIDLSKINTNSNIKSFLRGLFSANGSAVKQSDDRVHIVLTGTSSVLFDKVMLLMQSLGMMPKLYKTAGRQLEFSNGTYLCKDIYRIVLSRKDDINFYQDHIGFLQRYKMETLFNRRNPVAKNRKINSKITDVQDLGFHDVFHIEVDNNSHTYWTGGLDVSNCVLSSMNASKYREWKDTDAVFWATVFLDCIAQEFIEKAKPIKHLDKAVRFTEKGRALGLGLCGLHTLFMQENLAFEDFEAHMLSQEIQSLIMRKATEATKALAVILGEPEWCKGYGVRNTHLIAVAPTKSTALLMGGISEGINPDPAMTFTQTTAAGEIERVNPELLKALKKLGKYTPEVIQSIIDNHGSVQHLDFLDDHTKAVFKTAFEINQKAIIRMASARGRYIDQWQSLNLFFSSDEDESWIAEVHQEAFLDRNILGLYYVYSRSGVLASKGECLACQ